MKSLPKWILRFLLIQLSAIAWTVGEDISSPYCYRNITETTYKVVIKTRLKTVSSKGFFKKMTFKKETKVEAYEDQEPVYKIKLETYCCEGYKMTDLGLCEPQCVANGCPPHSKCVDPEVCECLMGYFSIRSPHDGKHYCEPICEKPCPDHSVCVAPNECACKTGFHVTADKQCTPYCVSGCPHEGRCVEPNVCECQEGYKAEMGSCLPVSSLGDQCPNRQSVRNEQCVCDQGFTWNSETLKCELNDYEWISTTYNPQFEDSQERHASMEVETDISTPNEDIDPNEVFDEDIEMSTTDKYGSSTPIFPIDGNHKCPHDYVFHEGQCRPLKFVSNEIDCWLKPCLDKRAICLENGTCACTEGYKWFRTHVVDHNSLSSTIEVTCLPLAEYEARLKQLKATPGETVIEERKNWTTIFLVVLGALIMVVALVLLGFKLLYKQSGAVDVEGKSLACVYNKRACCESDKSVI